LGDDVSDFDRVIRGGMVVTGSDAVRADVGIRGETIVALGLDLETRGAEVIDADGLLVTPGGVDTHCHIEQLEPDGSSYEDTFAIASAACFAGGTTSVITFAAQFKGERLGPVVAEYHRRAGRGMVDYSFHQIINDPFDAVITEDVPAIVASGIRSLKVFLTYDDVRVDDRQYLRVLAAARRAGALVAVHAENYDAIGWLTEAQSRDDVAQIPCLGSPDRDRTGGHSPRHRAGRADRSADPDFPRLGAGARGGNSKS
jgi:dihydropyrimidinase